MGVQDVVARLSNQSSKKKPNTSYNIPSLSKNNTTKLPPSPIPSPTSTMMLNNNNMNENGISSLIQKFDTSKTILSTPPESPNKLDITRRPRISLSNKTPEEIEEYIQSLLDQNNAAEEYILHLQSQVEKYAADATKVKDYEIRLEYLNTKLEQVSEERDFYENQLNEKVITPKQPVANEDMKNVQLAMMKYLSEMEKLKLESKALKQVVKKQDELITKLEEKLEYNSEELLKEQVQVQSIELNNKRELLAQLLNEREELIKSTYNHSSSSGRGKPPISAPPKHPLPPLTSSSSTFS